MLPPPDSPAGNLERLTALLREMFQLDRGDLDFGLYRIIKLQAGEITAFLDRDLLPQVKTEMDLSGAGELAALQAQLESARESASRLGIDPDANAPPAVVELQRRVAELRQDAAAEADVYNHLANFFARYYAEGDFVAQRRYMSGGRSAYLIPYDGEEVKLHWANAGQYYVKTTENYAGYAFTAGAGEAARRVRFEVAAADSARDAVGEAAGRQRRFVLAGRSGGRPAVAVEEGELVVRFEHRPLTDREKRRWPGNGNGQQERINAAAGDRILSAVTQDWRFLLAAPAPGEANADRTLLARHLARYTAGNSFDYFIHKDLGGFLRRELDLYLNREVLNPDDLDRGGAPRLDRALARVRAVRRVGRKIIDFLARLEDFQKQLWLKKKLVLETHWCVTLDRVPDSLLPEIAANAGQCDEWVRLFAVDRIEGDLMNGGAWKQPPSVELLKANPCLVVDTRHFDRGFTDRLLAALGEAGPLDEQTDGVLVQGENFQALNLLQARYRGQVRCIYIDPPYNTDASAILYKNDYKDSSWLSLMAEGLRLARAWLTEDGVLCAAIDDEEVSLLRLLLRGLLPRELGIVAVRSNPAGRKSRGQFSPAHEYALFFGNPAAVPGTLDKTARELARYPLTDEQGRYAWNNLIRHGSGDRRHDRPTMFFPIYVSHDDTIRVPEMEWDSDKQEYDLSEEPRDDEVAVWPIVVADGGVIEKRWHRGPERVRAALHDYRVRRNGKEGPAGGIEIDFKIRPDLGSMPKTWWDDARYASANLGAKTLKDLFGDKGFDFAKATGLVEDCLRASRCGAGAVVLDYFAGSGTTGHAVINLNREDGGGRRYVLVEVGRHFDTVLLPRLKKAIHSPDWKEGRPVSRRGLSQLFKYLRLEAYEDTLESLEATPPSVARRELLAAAPDLAEDYRLRYALGRETAGRAGLLGGVFTDPFSYTVAVMRGGARREVPVDLPETFNYLLGLRVASRRRIDGVLAIAGTDPEGRRCLILWRSLRATGYAELEAWFIRHRERFPRPLHLIYVNGDHTLNALLPPDEAWTAELIEPIFRELMFKEEQQ